VCGDFLPHRDAVQRRQHQIEDDEIRRLTIDARQCFETIARFDHVEAFQQERGLEHPPQFLVVLHDQDGLSPGHSGSIHWIGYSVKHSGTIDPVDRAAVLELIAQQHRAGFADLAGTEGQASIRVTDRLLNQIVATELAQSRAIRQVRVHAMNGDRLTVQLVLAKPSFLPPLNFEVDIERQPSLPQSPELVLKLAGLGGLTRFAGPAAAFLNVLPPGIRMIGDRVHVDLGALLEQRGLGFVLQYVDQVRVTTEEGALRIGFRVRVRPPSQP
jgi:hypothetical protein